MRLRLVQLYGGLVLYGISSSLLVLAGLGLDPWDVFHQGLSRTFGLAIGTWAIIVGVVVLLLWIPLRQRPGIGTVSNVVLVGADDERRARARARAARDGRADRVPGVRRLPQRRRDGRVHRGRARARAA